MDKKITGILLNVTQASNKHLYRDKDNWVMVWRGNERDFIAYENVNNSSLRRLAKLSRTMETKLFVSFEGLVQTLIQVS